MFDRREGIFADIEKILRYRSQGGELKESRERITSNSVSRALVGNFLERVDSLQMEAIQDEANLREWIGKLF